MSTKHQPYMEYYMKKNFLGSQHGIGHVRVKYVDENGIEHIRGLNQAGNAKEDYEPLKEDNDIGEKTTSAFNKLKEEDEDGLLASLDKMII